MSSLQPLREFIRDRLTAAAEEIFTEFEKTFVRYEEELDGLRRMMKINWKPQIKLNRIDLELQRQSSDLHQDCVSMMEESFVSKQFFNQGWRSSNDKKEEEPGWNKENQVEPEPRQMKDEKPEPKLIEEQYYSTLIKEDVELKAPLRDEEKNEPDNSKLKPKHEPTSPDQEDLCSIHISPVVERKDQKGIISTESENLQQARVSMMEESFVCKQFFNQGWRSSHDQKEEEPGCNKENQVEPEPRQMKDEKPEHKLIEEQYYSTLIKEDVELKAPLMDEEKNEPDNSKLKPKHEPTKPEQKELCSNPISPVVESKDRKGIISTESESESPADANKTLRCDICGRCYKCNSNLKKHYRIHTGEKPFICETCGKGFVRKSQLTVHSRNHTGEKPFACKTCGKCFVLKSQLTVHSRNHTGERPFSCETCGHGFLQMCALKLHKRIHTGEKPFSCETCGKCFVNKSHLTVHSRTHTGEKPFACKTCGKCFSRVDHLKNHEIIHTGVSCETCGKSFTSRSHFNDHRKTHTG